jgi:DNA-binding transcriptional LysR family regulator
MVAVRLTRDIRWVVVASPAYLAARGRPDRPEDLAAHEAIRYRYQTSGAIYRWEFERDGRDFSIDPPGGIIVNDGEVMISFARVGLGFAYAADIQVEADVNAGLLVRVLDAFVPKTPGLFLYFPRRAQAQPKLRAFIDVAKRVLRPGL